MVKEKTFIAKRCQTCHPEIYATYAQSVHGSALFNERNQDVPVCIDCHKAHNIENPFTLDYREKIPEMCGGCHANKAIAAKYGLSTEVVDTYLSDFHGVTLKFYQMQKDVLPPPAKPIAVCTDCHGTHDISSTIGPDANAVKARLVKRCQKCHEGATTNFPASWLPHYESSFAKSPLVFIVKLIYKILIPVMLAGLILQILLHIWRYAVNR
jgi:predicted CXXCH cytochrome family protein